MSTTVIAIKGTFGSTDYYLTKMKAQELVKLAHIPEWKEEKLEERYQRDLKLNRIKRDLVPYLAYNKARFFGAVIVASEGWADDQFEPVTDIFKRAVPNAYAGSAQNMGFYSFKGNENLYVLDGQHRIKALDYALRGLDEKDATLPSNKEIANDDVSVILIEYKLKIARQIFTTVNRQAKQVSTGETLITNDNDMVAVIAREISNELIGGRLVNYSSNNLTEKDYYFTTLATVASSTDEILQTILRPPKDYRKELPENSQQKIFKDQSFKYWKAALATINEWQESLEDKTETGDPRRKEMRAYYVNMRPMPQRCIMYALAYVTNQSRPIEIDEALKRLNLIDWRVERKLWDRLLIAGGKIQAKNEKVLKEVLIYILLGYEVEEEFEERLLKKYREIFPTEKQKEVSLDWIKSLHEQNRLP